MSEEAKSINKSAIKSFAIEARNILIKSATTEAGLYGISEDEIRTPIQKGPDFEVYETLAGTEKRIYRADMRRRENLVKAIQEKGFQEVIEETAYTWFNRLIAIRFMEVNDYLPTRTRVLSSETGNNTPDLINDFLDVDLGMTDEELQAVQTAKNENRYDDAFRLLFIKECNALNDILPGLFKKTDDYMELLLNMPYTSDGVVRMLIDTIPEKNFDVEKEGQIEIIGWLYQYYNTKPKAKAFGKKGKITKEEIPAVTQLFTPDWIVRYMVENSLGRIWLEGHPDKDLRDKWEYYLDEAQQNQTVECKLNEIKEEYKKLSPEDIRVIDPCMGSGHILVYLFEVLMQIYKHDGYTERDAAELILENNLFGLDIDDRAYQLSYFAILMKARQYNRNILKQHPTCHVYSVPDSNSINKKQLSYFGDGLNEIDKNNAFNQINGLVESFLDAKEYGSLLTIDNYDWELLLRFINSDCVSGQISFDTLGIDKTREQLIKLVKVGQILSEKFNVAITNPPYMSNRGMNEKLLPFIQKNYADSKADLFSAFIERCSSMTAKYGFQAMITMHSWMFLSSFKKLREKLTDQTLVSMAHLGPRAFDEINGEVVQTTSFVYLKANIPNYNGVFCRLVDGSDENDKKKMFLSGDMRYVVETSMFNVITGSPLAYWGSENALKNFRNYEPLINYSRPRVGQNTGDNERFLRLWFEVETSRIGFGVKHEDLGTSSYKWIPYNKGGSFRRWYGNFDRVVNWENDGKEIKDYAVVRNKGKHWSRYIQNIENMCREGISWSDIASTRFGCRYLPEGFICDVKGSSTYPDEKYRYYILGFLNSAVAIYYLQMLNPTTTFQVGNIGSLPFIFKNEEEVTDLVKQNVALSKADWDMYETSWDYKRTALFPTRYGNEPLIEVYKKYEIEVEDRFSRLKTNEEKLNRLFVDNYNLSGEVDTNVFDEDVTVSKPDKVEAVKSLISYAVGCMFGRYSTEIEGLVYSGGDWDMSKYGVFQPDCDSIIPITDEEYFEDDIVTRFVEFIKIVYGDTYLEENLEFIAGALKSKGNTSREVIRNYFVNDFYKDHCNTYSVTGSGKRPIYWLFDSGKQNGFKALIYIHRYNPDTVGLIRSTYLHKVQSAIENALQNAEYVISTSSSATEKAAASKKRDKYVKQLNELRPYYQALSHVALQRIDMDLDNGVKANYQLFQGVEISTEGKKKQKIDLLAKI